MKKNSFFSQYFKEHHERHLDELFEFLRIPSVSLYKKNKADVGRSIEWCLENLKKAGIQYTTILESNGHPSGYGELIVDDTLPTVLIYGHADVVDTGDEKLWEHPPFDPVIEEKKIFARGSSDDKGGIFIPIKVVEAFIALEGKLPFNIKFFIEGEEELLSPNLFQVLSENKELLSCDVIISADNIMYETGKPSITVGSRGYCSLEIDVKGPAFELHSGLYGGSVRNPIIVLSDILSSFHTQDGKVAVEGFYDDVQVITPEERAEINSLSFNKSEYAQSIGVKNSEIIFGEPGYSTLERIWVRPTLEICGISGGYEGHGTKNIIPSRSHAKISCRLVPNQDPDTILQLVESHIIKKIPAGMDVQVNRNIGKGQPYVTPRKHTVLKASTYALYHAWEEKPVFCRTGGSIAMAALAPQLLNAPFFFFSFSEPDNQAHAPNEFFRIDVFEKGLMAYVNLFQNITVAKLRK